MQKGLVAGVPARNSMILSAMSGVRWRTVPSTVCLKLIVVELGFGQGEGFALSGGTADGVLAEEGGAVAFAAEDGGVGFGELSGGERGQEIGDAVAAHVLAGEDGGATTAADRRGYEVIPEQNAVFGELINMGRFDDGVAVTAEVVEPLVVGLDEEDVGTVGLGR